MSQSGTQVSRVTRSREEAKASYDRMSKWYDTLAGRFEREYREKGLQTLRVKEGETVLEVGFGTGHCIVALARSVGPSGKVYGIDLSPGMLRVTLSKVEKGGLSERVRLVRGDAVKLPFAASLFDAVFLSFALELFDTPEIPVLLHECQRVLRYSGRICVVALSREEKAGPMVRLYEWVHERFPNYVDCRPIFVQQTMEDARFQVLEAIEMSMWGLPVEIVLAKKTSS